MTYLWIMLILCSIKVVQNVLLKMYYELYLFKNTHFTILSTIALHLQLVFVCGFIQVKACGVETNFLHWAVVSFVARKLKRTCRVQPTTRTFGFLLRRVMSNICIVIILSCVLWIWGREDHCSRFSEEENLHRLCCPDRIVHTGFRKSKHFKSGNIWGVLQNGDVGWPQGVTPAIWGVVAVTREVMTPPAPASCPSHCLATDKNNKATCSQTKK